MAPLAPRRAGAPPFAAAAAGGCAEYGFSTGVSPAAEKSLRESIQKEFDLMVRDFDALDGLQGVLERYLEAADPRRDAALEAARADQIQFLNYWRMQL